MTETHIHIHTNDSKRRRRKVTDTMRRRWARDFTPEQIKAASVKYSRERFKTAMEDLREALDYLEDARDQGDKNAIQRATSAVTKMKAEAKRWENDLREAMNS